MQRAADRVGLPLFDFIFYALFLHIMSTFLSVFKTSLFVDLNSL